MSKPFQRRAACPYCGEDAVFYTEADAGYPKAAYCDMDVGGCDRLVVVIAKKYITANCFKVEDATDGNS